MNNQATTKELALQLKGMTKKIESLLPKQITSERFNRTVMMAIERNPYLLKMEQHSLLKACQLAAADGLLLDGREAALVPFNKEVNYIPMYQGVLKKIRQSGELASIFCNVVTKAEYEVGAFKYWIDMNGQHLEHTPDLENSGGELFCAYMFATLKDGSTQIEVVSGDRIRKIKQDKVGQIKDQWKRDKAPWIAHEAQMWKKTALLSGAKYLPQSSELSNIFESEQAQHEAQEINITPKTAAPVQLETVDENGEIQSGSFEDLPAEFS